MSTRLQLVPVSLAHCTWGVRFRLEGGAAPADAYDRVSTKRHGAELIREACVRGEEANRP